jgi:hypothetical protein
MMILMTNPSYEGWTKLAQFDGYCNIIMSITP